MSGGEDSVSVVPPQSPAAQVTLESIREAAAGLRGVAVRTALKSLGALSALAGVPVYLKPENEQPSGAFKLRGAWTAVRRLPEYERRTGVITYSSGNHGQAVAFAAKRLGIRAVIVMPETAPEAKIAGVKRWNGEVVMAGTTSQERREKAYEIVASEGLAVIPPFDHPDVIAGQATVGLEIVEDLPNVAHVVVPVGGGGLCGGICAALDYLSPETDVVAVEPAGAPAYREALKVGQPVGLARCASVADGLLPLAVGSLTFERMKPRARPVTVTDTAIVEATQWLSEALDAAVEPSGAATTAALRSGVLDLTGPTVLVVSGGNIDRATIPNLKPVVV